MFLSIDTSRDACSVALLDGQHVEERRSDATRSHAKLVAPFAAELLGRMERGRVDGIVVVAGPGSYTGLRIGLASAKGLCLALSVPLYAVSTLEVMAFAAWSSRPPGQFSVDTAVTIVPRFPARKGEWYMGAYQMVSDKTGALAWPESVGPDAVVPDADVVSWLSRHLGSRTLLETQAGATATWAARLVQKNPHAYLQEEASTFEPYYLKDVAARPRTGSIFDRLPFGGS